MTSDQAEKKVLVLLGSPRKTGNSTILAGEIAKGAEAAGATVETLFIQGMNIKPCHGCWSCQQQDTKGCVIDDDMQDVYPKLVDAQAWVIATPVHWFNMSTQTKLWLDRCFALAAYGENVFRKTVGIAITYGDSDPYTSGGINAIRSFQDSFRYVGAKIAGIVYGSATKVGEINQDTALLRAAEDLGRKLAK
jgi:multimeric flavodoxin WrbA